MKTLLCIDGNSILNRAFYGIRPLTTKDGTPTNALYGMINIFTKHIEDYKPDFAAVAFDLKAPTFRHKMYDEYKAGRHAMPEELAAQMPIAKQIVPMLGMHVLQLEGYEADDILGTLAAMARAYSEDCRALVLTGDRDSLQLVTEKSHVLFTESGISKTVEYTPDLVKEKHGVTPAQIPDLKGLMGDSSDNIPGVPGVGKVTAVKLISEYGSVEAALDAADTQLKGKLRERMLDGRQSALMSKKIATITRSVPIDTLPQDCPVTHLMDGAPVLEGLELKSLLPRLRELSEQENDEDTPVQGAAPALVFSEPVTLLSREDADAFLAARAEDALVAVLAGMDFSLACSDGACARIEIAQDLLTAGCDPSQAAAMLASLWTGKRPIVFFDAKKMLHR